MHWFQWFADRQFKTSFADDHPAGGSYKHMRMLKVNKRSATFVVLGYYGVDELQELAALPANSSLDVTAFIKKYNAPFHAVINIPIKDLAQPLESSIVCTFHFKKDTHGLNYEPMETRWTHDQATDSVTITFADMVTRGSKQEFNKWISTDLVPYERDATLNQAWFIDRCLI